ncbi:MAG: pentapeptide repeat-containing protein [Hyphomicrobiales bacterium]
MAMKIEVLDDEGEILKTYVVPEDKEQFEGVQWEGAYLYGAQLSGANFKDAELYSTGFFMANLDGANFENAGLQGVNLIEASCIGTNFRNANLGKDNLGGSSQLQGANLSKAILNRANLEGAEYNDETIFPKDFHPKSHGMVKIDD